MSTYLVPARQSHQKVRAMPQRFNRHGSAPQPLSLVLSILLCSLVWSIPAQAEVRVVSGQGEHRMGDRDTREDAVRLATEVAKRNALEQVATYLESVTVVEGLNVTRDEIHTYTAGLVLVLDQQVNTTLDNGIVVVQVNLEAQIDTEEVEQAIAALRENEDARHQLVALKEENEQLQQELDAANQALANASTPEQTQQAAQQRQDILNRVQSNAMVSQAWTDWVLVSPVVYPNPWVGLAQTHALLNVARGLYPTSPHVAAAQQVITTRQPPVPPQPPMPPLPGTITSRMPSHQITSPPSSQPVPRTLNELTHKTPTAPPHIGNQPVVTTQPGSRGFTDVRQLNPLLPPQFQNGAPPNSSPPVSPGSRSARALQQFLAPPAPGQVQIGRPPGAGRLPPTINQIHPPTPQQMPRAPYQIAPRGFGGGGGKYGAGGGGRGGGNGGGAGRGGGGGGKSGGRGR